MKFYNIVKNNLTKIEYNQFQQKNNDIKSCPSGKCNNYGFVIEQDLCDDELECSNCHTKWRDYSIATYEARLLYQLQNITSSIKEFLYYFIRTNECPGCGILIQRNGGCKHMTCVKCLLQFCWQCKSDWDAHQEHRCSTFSISFISLLLFQPLTLLYQLRIQSYFVFLLYPFRLLALLLSTHFIVIGSMQVLGFLIKTFYDIARNTNQFLNIVFYLTLQLQPLYFQQFLYSIFTMELILYWLQLLFNFFGPDGIGICFWLLSLTSNLKFHPLVLKAISYFLFILFNLYEFSDLLIKPYFIFIAVIDLIIFRKEILSYLNN